MNYSWKHISVINVMMQLPRQYIVPICFPSKVGNYSLGPDGEKFHTPYISLHLSNRVAFMFPPVTEHVAIKEY